MILGGVQGVAGERGTRKHSVRKNAGCKPAGLKAGSGRVSVKPGNPRPVWRPPPPPHTHTHTTLPLPPPSWSVGIMLWEMVDGAVPKWAAVSWYWTKTLHCPDTFSPELKVWRRGSREGKGEGDGEGGRLARNFRVTDAAAHMSSGSCDAPLPQLQAPSIPIHTHKSTPTLPLPASTPASSPPPCRTCCAGCWRSRRATDPQPPPRWATAGSRRWTCRRCGPGRCRRPRRRSWRAS